MWTCLSLLSFRSTFSSYAHYKIPGNICFQVHSPSFSSRPVLSYDHILVKSIRAKVLWINTHFEWSSTYSILSMNYRIRNITFVISIRSLVSNILELSPSKFAKIMTWYISGGSHLSPQVADRKTEIERCRQENTMKREGRIRKMYPYQVTTFLIAAHFGIQILVTIW